MFTCINIIIHAYHIGDIETIGVVSNEVKTIIQIHNYTLSDRENFTNAEYNKCSKLLVTR